MDRSSLIFLARLAEEAERYDEMADHMKRVAVDFDDEFTAEESNLFAVAYKNKISSRRAGWRVIRAIELKSKDDKKATAIQAYRQRIEQEVDQVCRDVIDTIDGCLLPNATEVESQAFLHKMKGDYYRYLAEIATPTNDTSAKLALASYEESWSLVTSALPPMHPLRLGLALNFSVFYSDVMNSPERAVRLAKQSFDDAIEDLDALSEESYRDTTLIMQLLRDNVTLWLSANDE